VTSETGPEPPAETLTDHELLVRIARIVDHLDPLVHEVHNWAAQAAPLLQRFGGFRAAMGKAGRRGQG
jgi:hypothetical protein